MQKLNILYVTRDGEDLLKIKDEPLEGEDFFRKGIAYLDLIEVIIIEETTPYKGSDCCNITMKSGDRLTVVSNMGVLAEQVERVKQYGRISFN